MCLNLQREHYRRRVDRCFFCGRDSNRIPLLSVSNKITLLILFIHFFPPYCNKYYSMSHTLHCPGMSFYEFQPFLEHYLIIISVLWYNAVFCCCISRRSTLWQNYFNFNHRKDRKMALVTLTTTEEAIDALIVSFILLFQKMSIPMPWKVIGNSEGVGSQKPEILKESLKLEWTFQRVGGWNHKSFHMEGIDIFLERITIVLLLVSIYSKHVLNYYSSNNFPTLLSPFPFPRWSPICTCTSILLCISYTVIYELKQ